MTKEEKVIKSLERMNMNANYGISPTPKYDYLSEAAKDILNEMGNHTSDIVKTKGDNNKTCLIIRCISNKNYCMINSIKFKNINTGEIITIDRDRTECTSIELSKHTVIQIPDNINSYRYSLHMLWIDCYIWDGTTKDYDVDFDELEFVEFDIEDGADVDYKLDLMEYESAPHIS